MTRKRFEAAFGTSCAVLPVIHVLDSDQMSSNMEITAEAGAAGCFLINHDFSVEDFLPLIVEARARFPDIWLGVNLLGYYADEAFPVLKDLETKGTRIDGFWADNAGIDEFAVEQDVALEIDEARQRSGWDGLYFGGTAFKYHRTVAPEHYGRVAQTAAGFMDVVTTTGPATGKAADPSKIDAFREAVDDYPIAIASGITPENAGLFQSADCFIVATGINHPGDFYNIDPDRLRRLLEITKAVD